MPFSSLYWKVNLTSRIASAAVAVDSRETLAYQEDVEAVAAVWLSIPVGRMILGVGECFRAVPATHPEPALPLDFETFQTGKSAPFHFVGQSQDPGLKPLPRLICPSLTGSSLVLKLVHRPPCVTVDSPSMVLDKAFAVG